MVLGQSKTFFLCTNLLISENKIFKEIGAFDVDINIFIDELTYTPFMGGFDALEDILSSKSYFWVSIGRESRILTDTDNILPFKDWLERKTKEKGFYEPKLSYALRNSKEIIDFDSKYSDTGRFF